MLPDIPMSELLEELRAGCCQFMQSAFRLALRQEREKQALDLAEEHKPKLQTKCPPFVNPWTKPPTE